MKYLSLIILSLVFFACNQSSEKEEEEESSDYTVEYYIEADESTFIEELEYLDGKGEWATVDDADGNWAKVVSIPKGGKAGLKVEGGSNSLVKAGYVAELGAISRKYAESKEGLGYHNFSISFEKSLE
jgi:hypothetical protein